MVNYTKQDSQDPLRLTTQNKIAKTLKHETR